MINTLFKIIYLELQTNMSNLLKNNAYHILGLDISASQKDILKRSREIIKLIQIDDIPKYDLDLGIFDNFRTEDTVKDAVERLTSPKKQIKEYFFWFNIADEIDEQAVGILRKNDPDGAIRVWEHHSEGDSTKALFYKRNLAILYCILLFKENNDVYLKSSLKIWNELVKSTKFWTAFSKIYKLNDELNVNQETIEDFQKNCLSYISDLYTELAESKKDNKFVAEFSNIFNTKGGRTEKILLAPIFDKMTSAIEKLESLKVSEDGIFHKEKSAILKESVSIIQSGCNELTDLGLFDDSQAKLIRERAADAFRSISIDLNNNLNETAVALGLAKIAEKISGTEGFKNKIQADLKQIQQNDDYKNNEAKYKAILDPIIEDFKSGKSDKALKTINDYLDDETTDEALKKNLKEIKDVIEERIAKQGKPVSKAPSLWTIWGVGTKIYGNTLYFVFFFIPIFPISKWNLTDHKNGRYSFHGKLELSEQEKLWRTGGIIAIVFLVIWWISANN